MPGAVFSSADSCSSTVPKTSCVTGVLLPLFLWHTRRIYRKLARWTAAEIEDYQKAALPS
jgi:hypothetical protein